MRVGIVGVGFMSWIHYLAYQRSSQCEVVAFCSRNEAKRSGDWRDIQGNFGPPGEQIDVSGLGVYPAIDDLIADENVDVVDICLPPSLHADVIRQCVAAAKPVFCEKPLALDHATALSLAQEAGASQLMVGHVLPLMNEFELVYQAAQDGRYGKPVAGRFKRTISPPDWIPDFYDPKTVGGPLVDLHVHDAHLIRVLFGMPTTAHSVCTRQNGVPKFYETVFAFEAADRVVSCGGGVMDSPARPFTHGYEVTFETATIQFEFAAYADGSTANIPVTILHNDGRIERPEMGDGDPIAAFVKEVELVASCYHDKKTSPILDPMMAADALKICEMQM